MRDLALLEQTQRDTSAAKWQSSRPQHILSLADIQAEEKLRQVAGAAELSQRKEKKEMEVLVSNLLVLAPKFGKKI